MIEVQGFPWCKGERRSVGISGLTSKILCTDHNSRLSELDIAAGHAFKSFDKVSQETNARLIGKDTRFKVHHVNIDGPRLERWLVKTLLNLHVSGSMAGGGQPSGVSEHLVRIAFGSEAFKGKSGLYLAARQGWQLNSRNEIKVTPLIDDGIIMGGFFNFRGWLLILWPYENEMPKSLDGCGLGDEWHGVEPSWHFKTINFDVRNIRSHVVNFVWPKAASS